MKATMISMPAGYAVLSNDEMVYVDGGALSLSTLQNAAAAVSSFSAAFCETMVDSIKSCARSFVEIHLDDLHNPNFWTAVAMTGILAAIGFGLSSFESEKK